MKFKKVLVLTIFIVFLNFNNVLAIELQNYDGSPDVNGTVHIHYNWDTGAFQDLTYIISSSGATAGIRYRTSAIKINVGSYTYTVDAASLTNFKPAAGSTVYSQITVTTQDIINAIGQSHESEVLSLLSHPENSVTIGATIQIYNAATGAVLANIDNENDVANVASQYGFGQTDINDMESRYQDTPGQPTESIQPTPPPSNGLRPSILVQ